MSQQRHASPWLNAKRLRAHGLILGVAIWSVYLWTVWTPGLRDRSGNLKGTDFLHLYTIGTLAREHRGAELYDMQAQAALAAERVPEAAGIRYLPLYPPQVSIFFAPLAALPYGEALALWWAFSAGLYAICCYGVWRASPHLRGHGWTVAAVAAAFPAFFHLIAWGQSSAVALACFTLMFFLLRSDQKFLAGAALGCLIFKPQLGLAAAIVFLSMGAWKTVAGALLSAAAELWMGVAYYGIAPLRGWVATLRHARLVMAWIEPRPYQTHCLRTFWSMLIPWEPLAAGLYAISAITILAATIALWRRSAPLAVRFPALLLATVLVAPHLTVYDLVIIVPGILLLTDWLAGLAPSRRTQSLGALLYLAYLLPLVGPFARWTHVQFSVIAMAALVFLLSSDLARSPEQKSQRIGETARPG